MGFKGHARAFAATALAGICVLTLSVGMRPAAAQDMVNALDLTSDDFTKADMSRADIEAGLAKLKAGETLDLSGKRLNGLDLSGLDLTRTRLQAARLNNANLKDAKLDGVVLDAAWALKSDFTNASFIGASLFQTQMMDARIDGANFSHAMVGADMSRATLNGARFDNARILNEAGVRIAFSFPDSFQVRKNLDGHYEHVKPAVRSTWPNLDDDLEYGDSPDD